MKLSIKRMTALVLSVVLLSVQMPTVSYAAKPAEKEVYRVYGETRYETAYRIVDVLQEESKRDTFDAVVLANGKNFPDALSGSYLAVTKNAPILMVNESRQEEVVRQVEEKLTAGGTVYILGGEKAVSKDLEEKLAGISVVRLAGDTRYGTNLEILKQSGVTGGEILVCTGGGFSDSLSAAAAKRPIFLVGDRLTAEQKEYLETLVQPAFCVIGGEEAVSGKLEAELKTYGEVTRLAGATRQETSAAVAEAFFPEPAAAILAYAWNFPDGLCGGPLAVQLGGPVLLASDASHDAAQSYAESKGIDNGIVLGGSGLIGDETVRAVFGMESNASVPEWYSEKELMSQVKPENVEAVRAYAKRLYEENTYDDYTRAIFTWDGAIRASNWIYFTGVVYDSFLRTDFDTYNPEVRKFFNQHIREDGSIPAYIPGELDAAMLPAVMMELLNSGVLTEEERVRYAAAADYVYDQLEKQTIYPQAGNLWLHSQNADGSPRPAWTKWNVCLDGVFMSQGFLIRLAEAINRGYVQITDKNGNTVTEEQLWNDIYSRMVFVMENMRDPETGLLFHGYCVATGETNKACWSRGLGWYTMVLMEAAEKMPDSDKKAVLTKYFEEIMTAVVTWQDPATGLWYNVTDGREEYFCTKVIGGVETAIYNIPESSGSAMFSYCLLRGYDSGLLKDERLRAAGLWAFNSLVETKMTAEGLTDIYHSSSVTSNKNLYQVNGYVTNDGKGVGPLISASNYVH